jgi:hypothetical protein
MPNYGLVIPKRVATKEEGAEHILGSSNLQERVINKNGDWIDYLPDREPQRVNGEETNACTYYGTLSALETLDKFRGETTNYSDRLPANVGKTLGLLNPKSGANPHDTAEVIRKESGMLSEVECPWGSPYYSLDTAPLLPRAREWYKKRKIAHKWVFFGDKTPEEKRTLLQDALTKGTVCVSVCAWHKRDNVFYKPEGARDNHWVMLISANEGEPYKIFDSYDAYVKDLDPLYDFYMAKVYFYRPLPFTKNLWFGMAHDDVRRLQAELVGLGYSIPNGITDYYGVETRKAVWEFQMKNGIASDGKSFGPKTRLALNRVLNPDEYFGGSFMTFVDSILSSD